MYDKKIIQDGDPAFGLTDTFRVSNTIYVMSNEADAHLLSVLGDREYEFDRYESGDGYVANKRHSTSMDEMLDNIIAGDLTEEPLSIRIDLKYKDGNKLDLTVPNIHEVILSAAGHPSDLKFYKRSTDYFEEKIISRMSGFVKNIIDVPYGAWQEFLQTARHYHAKDFIRAMAYWAAQQSDMKPRPVKIAFGHYEREMIDPNKPFVPIMPNKGFRITRLGL